MGSTRGVNSAAQFPEARQGDARHGPESRHVERHTAERHAATAAPPPTTESARSSRRQFFPPQVAASPHVSSPPGPGLHIPANAAVISAGGVAIGGARGVRSGGQATPRPTAVTECERGRAALGSATTSTWPLRGQKDARERSLGAKPRSPQGRSREVNSGYHPGVGAGNANAPNARGAVSLAAPGNANDGPPAARRRTSPSASMARSTSADERG